MINRIFYDFCFDKVKRPYVYDVCMLDSTIHPTFPTYGSFSFDAPLHAPFYFAHFPSRILKKKEKDSVAEISYTLNQVMLENWNWK